MRVRLLQTTDAEALASCWLNFSKAKFQIEPELLRTHVFSCPVWNAQLSFVIESNAEIVALAIFKDSPTPRLYGGYDHRSGYLSFIAHSGEMNRKLLIETVRDRMGGSSYRSLTFGQDARHFFPGCPQDLSELRDVLKGIGLIKVGECYDLERDFAGQCSIDFSRRVSADDPQFVIRVCRADDLQELRVFFDDEFPNRWKFDVFDKIVVDGPQCVLGQFSGKTVTGFALLQDSSHLLRIGGAVCPPCDRWATIGPIGIARSLRGLGLGSKLLLEAIETLKKKAVEKCVIDWTTLVSFYDRFGFQVSRLYDQMRIDLG